MKRLIKKILSEEFDDLQWIHDIKPTEYKFFDINVCYYFYEDLEYGEECVEGGSYFIKIPTTDYYNLTGGDMVFDEELVIDWAIDYNYLDPAEYSMVYNVSEVNKEEFCQAVGMWEKELCSETVKESNELDWISGDRNDIIDLVFLALEGTEFSIEQDRGKTFIIDPNQSSVIHLDPSNSFEDLISKLKLKKASLSFLIRQEHTPNKLYREKLTNLNKLIEILSNYWEKYIK